MQKVDDLTNAQGALNFIQSDGKKNADDLKDAYSILANYCGVSADQLRNNLDPAIWAIDSDMAMAESTAGYQAQMLYSAAGVQFDAANWQSQQAALAASADATTANVATLVSSMQQAAGASLYLDGDTVKVKWGSQSGYKPPSSKKSGGGGRGGGGSSGGSSGTGNEMSEVEKMLDLMDQIEKIQNHKREMMKLAQSYHEGRGEIQGVILYLEQEKEIIDQNNATLRDNLSRIEAQIEAKKREVNSLDKSTDEYKQAASDLKALQDAHMDYSQQLLQNQIDIDNLNDAIKEQHNIIREMEIELRETILQAIKDREELNERMLQGTINVENEILEILKERYEQERDMILEASEEKKAALEEEKALQDEQLNARKEQAQQEEKSAKLASLEAQQARISADPTRKKEELALRAEIQKLREEMAWDIAEEEVKAQQDAIDEQITSIDDYMEYIENYYEELFKHPTKLIEEMRDLMQKSDDEILEWLKQNSEEFAASTEATQTDMINGWQEMLDDMHGAIEDHWDEVESIIAQGDEAIIAFLQENSADYREAGKLQAEAYVDQWREQLDNLRKAHQQVMKEISSSNYVTVSPGTGSGGGSSGSGGSSGGGSSSSKKPYYTFTFNGTAYGADKSYGSIDAAKSKINALTTNWANQIGHSGQQAQALYNAAVKTIAGPKYLRGGIADFTGPAWLDGSKTNPERILSPYQTELFEDMVKSLHMINTLRIPSMPSYSESVTEKPSSVSFGDIVVNVDKLSDDKDYEEVAAKLFDTMLEKMNRSAVVGGIRLTR